MTLPRGLWPEPGWGHCQGGGASWPKRPQKGGPTTSLVHAVSKKGVRQVAQAERSLPCGGANPRQTGGANNWGWSHRHGGVRTFLEFTVLLSLFRLLRSTAPSFDPRDPRAAPAAGRHAAHRRGSPISHRLRVGAPAPCPLRWDGDFSKKYPNGHDDF